jgi:hypothetical protein
MPTSDNSSIIKKLQEEIVFMYDHEYFKLVKFITDENYFYIWTCYKDGHTKEREGWITEFTRKSITCNYGKFGKLFTYKIPYTRIKFINELEKNKNENTTAAASNDL